MIKYILVVGDLHLNRNSPKYDQVIDFLNWLFLESGYNNEETLLILLGDLVETLDDPSELLEIYIDLFINKSKFNKIKVLKGNHDENMNSSFTSALRPLHNVEVIEYYKEDIIEGVKCLFLPYYDHTKIKDIPMYERYSDPNKYMKNYVDSNSNYDYVFHHVEDEQNHYSKKYCDLSWIKTDNWLCGHIHTENVTKGGRILGAPIFNSSTESGKTPYIARIDISTKKYELIKVPIYLEYYSVDYPTDLPEIKTKYAIWTVNESLNKKETIDYYSKQAKEKGYEFYSRRINSKRMEKKLVEGNKEDTNKKTDIELFEQYAKDNKIDNDIADICRTIIKKE
jgi:hypothetical protein